MSDVVVIGGGAAGMAAALFAARAGASVILLEKNEKLGKKVYITGKGRCNLTNDCDVDEFMAQVPRNPRFLYSALNFFSPRDMMALLESSGCPVQVQRGRRVFPVSEKASDVTRALQSCLRSAGVSVRLGAEVHALESESGRLTGVRLEDGSFVPAGAVIVCTGGISYPSTGSTGDGYRFAEEAGHTVLPQSPVLVGLETQEAWPRTLQGLSLRNVTLTLSRKGKVLYSELGEMLFTHFGISGPLVLSASSRMRRIDSARYRAEIDLKPALDEKSLDRRILRDLSSYHNKALHNALIDLVPHALIPELIRLCDIETEPNANEVTKELRMRLLHALKAFPIEISGTRPYEEAIITAGGVRLRELDPRSMQSRLVQGLYFAGEVLDLDAYTGGFNLQIAWSTGRLAGISAAGSVQIQISGSAT